MMRIPLKRPDLQIDHHGTARFSILRGDYTYEVEYETGLSTVFVTVKDAQGRAMSKTYLDLDNHASVHELLTEYLLMGTN